MRASAMAHREATYDGLALGECQMDIPSPEYCQAMRADVLALTQAVSAETAKLTNTTLMPNAAACRAYAPPVWPVMGGAQ
jgi:hypothetical protein